MTNAPDVPLQFGDSLLMNAAFPLPSSNARSLLPPDTGIHLVEVFPKRAVLIVSFALYRESPFGTYAEATLALMASHEKTTPVMTLTRLMQESRYPAFVLHMLVTNEQAQRVGVEHWALPRQMARVDIAEHSRQTIGTASLEGKSVVQMVVDRPATNRTRQGQIETYSQRGGTLLHAVMHCDSRAYGRTQGSGAALIWGEHPIGEHLANMGVSQVPLMLRYYEHTRAELHSPVQCAPA